MRYGLVVFDFDGTLVDSNALKRNGFFHIFADRPECLNTVQRVLDSSNSTSRYEIISSIASGLTDLLREDREAEIRRRTQAYADWIEERIIDKAALSPAGVLLRRWHQQLPLYLCSLTPTEPLRRTLTRLDWIRYFCGVEGYPVSKVELLRATVVRHRLHPEQAVMVGDSDTDEAAAVAAGTQFFRVRDTTDLWKLDRELQP